MARKGESFPCPHCGGMVPPGARACPECGSDERTGWSEWTYLDGIDLPDASDYEETLRREGLRGSEKAHSRGRFWVAAALLLILLFCLRFILCAVV
jgi:RNA polymerase subunit RPABC4/transcription elongation factor Spt4